MHDPSAGPELRLGLIGDHIARSVAPLLHEIAGEQAGVRVTYDRLEPEVLGTDFETLFTQCPARGYRGVNVTHPYKERAARMVRIDDPLTRAIGAVNTVLFERDEPLGFNTDYSGFISAYRNSRTARPRVVCLLGAVLQANERERWVTVLQRAQTTRNSVFHQRPQSSANPADAAFWVPERFPDDGREPSVASLLRMLADARRRVIERRRST